MSEQPYATPTDPTPTPPDAAPEETAAPGLHRGQLVTYVVVDDAGLESLATALVVDLFDADGVTHARLSPLPAPLALSVAALIPLS